MALTKWDSATATAVALSGSNLVATNTGTTSTNQGAKVATAGGNTTGKYYFECTVTAYTGGAGVGAGVGTTAATYANLSANGPGGVMCFVVGHTGTGTILANASNTGLSLGALANGDVLCVAADLINRRLWFRKGVSGLWNGNPIGSSDPTVGDGTRGGVTIPAGTIVPFVTFGSGPAGAAGVANNVITANFGASAFSGAVPAGYVAGWGVQSVPIVGHYFGVAERWDRGHWDVAHWNGQLGVTAQTYAITIGTGNSVLQGGHMLPASTAQLQISGIPIICRAGRGMRAAQSNIIVTGFDINTQLNWHAKMEAAITPDKGQIVVTGNWAELKPFLGPGVLNFGIPVRLGQW